MELQLSLDGRAQIFFVVKVSRGRQSKLLGRLVKNVDVQPATTNGILMNGISRRLQKKKSAPGRGFICDLNGKIEYVVPKRVARSSSEIKLRCEPTWMLSQRIERVTCEKKNGTLIRLIQVGERKGVRTWAIGNAFGIMLLLLKSTADPIKKL
jgi:hypothetical protein